MGVSGAGYAGIAPGMAGGGVSESRAESGAPRPGAIPGTIPTRYRPRFHWELLVCGTRGHELVGTDTAELRPQDAVIVREINAERWYRCLRCDSWLPLAPPAHPTRRTLPPRDEIRLPRRGKALRDRVVLRLIAIDRVVHFIVLGLIATGIFVFAQNESQLKHRYYTLLARWQAAGGGPIQQGHIGLAHDLNRLFSLSGGTLRLLGAGIAAYALLEAAEAVGLWWQKRWAEYLTFVATTVFLPLELDELAHGITWFRGFALAVNILILLYLLFAKRLFGVRGGAAADRRARDRDSGWPALEAVTPP